MCSQCLLLRLAQCLHSEGRTHLLWKRFFPNTLIAFETALKTVTLCNQPNCLYDSYLFNSIARDVWVFLQWKEEEFKARDDKWSFKGLYYYLCIVNYEFAKPDSKAKSLVSKFFISLVATKALYSVWKNLMLVTWLVFPFNHFFVFLTHSTCFSTLTCFSLLKEVTDMN